MTPNELQESIGTAVETLLMDADPFRMASDFDVRDQAIPRGTTGYQLQGFVLPQEPRAFHESNVYRTAMSVRLLVHRALAVDETELTWSNGGMQTALTSLIDPRWWDAISGVYAVVVEPVGSNLARVGNVVSFTVVVAVTVDSEA